MYLKIHVRSICKIFRIDGYELDFKLRFGASLEGFCDNNECVPLEEAKRNNILG